MRPRDPHRARHGESSVLDLWLDTVWGTQPAPHLGFFRRLRVRVLRVGPVWACVVVTLLGVAASLAVSLLINLLIHRSTHDMGVSLLMSGLIPLLVGPTITWLVMLLLGDAETARRAAEWLAVTDPLTGTFNRRHFFIAGERWFAHSRQAQEQLCVLLLDVDDFKAINDQHGHAAGDRVLIAVAEACKASLRETDLLARYGGEEFVALLPATDMARALQIAERMRAAVAGADVIADNGAIVRPTASVGVSALTAAPVSFDALLAQADRAMYGAKRDGKNRVGAGPAASAPATLAPLIPGVTQAIG